MQMDDILRKMLQESNQLSPSLPQQPGPRIIFLNLNLTYCNDLRVSA